MGLFEKKASKSDGVNIMHYEGLPGFRQDFPCNMKAEPDKVVFSNAEGSTVTLAAAQITGIDWMREDMFMGKYHNNPVNTSKSNAVKWFAVINYSSSSGESKYIAFWSTTAKEKDYLQKTIQIVPSHITL